VTNDYFNALYGFRFSNYFRKYRFNNNHVLDYSSSYLLHEVSMLEKSKEFITTIREFSQISRCALDMGGVDIRPDTYSKLLRQGLFDGWSVAPFNFKLSNSADEIDSIISFTEKKRDEGEYALTYSNRKFIVGIKSLNIISNYFGTKLRKIASKDDASSVGMDLYILETERSITAPASFDITSRINDYEIKAKELDDSRSETSDRSIEIDDKPAKKKNSWVPRGRGGRGGNRGSRSSGRSRGRGNYREF
jgi:hypothetical protein